MSYRLFSAISLIFGAVFIIYFLVNDSYYPYQTKNPVLIEANSGDNTAEAYDHGSIVTLLEYLRDSRKEHYFKALSQLEKAISGAIVLIVLSIIILFYNPREQDISIFGFTMPLMAFHIIIPLGLLYFFLQFGFTAFSAIESRESLYKLSLELEKAYINEEAITINKEHSSVYGIEDGGMIDAWSNVFFGFYDKINPDGSAQMKLSFDGGKIAVTTSLFGIFGTFMALMMGCSLMVLLVFQRINPERKWLIYLLTAVLLLFFLLAHLALVVEARYAAIFSGYSWLVTALFITFAIKLIPGKLK